MEKYGEAHVHPLVTLLRFTRSEILHYLKDVSPEDAVRRVLPLNCISWTIGHLANQEQSYWVLMAQNKLKSQTSTTVWVLENRPARHHWRKCGRPGIR